MRGWKNIPSEKCDDGNPGERYMSIDSNGRSVNHLIVAQNTNVLIIGGSLGARTINESIINGIEKLIEAQIQVLWQTGKGYYSAYKTRLAKYDLRKIRVQDFMREMDLAYAAADVIISRSGALTVSEICIARRPVLAFPNVAEIITLKCQRSG